MLFLHTDDSSMAGMCTGPAPILCPERSELVGMNGLVVAHTESSSDEIDAFDGLRPSHTPAPVEHPSTSPIGVNGTGGWFNTRWNFSCD